MLELPNFDRMTTILNKTDNFADNFTKLSKIYFSMECFTAEFLQFFTEKRQTLAFE